MTTKKIPISFQYLKDEGSDLVVSVILEYRQGRFPVQRAAVNAYGVVEILGSDGVVESMGSRESPCELSVIEQLRNSKEGMLFVEFDQNRSVFVGEQNITARFFN